METDINRHHIWHERKNYYTPTEKTLRGLGGFVLGIYAPAHRLLHAQMKPMVKPPRQMQNYIIDFAIGIEPETRFDVLDQVAAHLLEKPFRSYEDNIRAARLGQHLTQQRAYFNMHPLPEDGYNG